MGAVSMDALLRSDSFSIEFVLEQPHRAELLVSGKDQPNRVGLLGHDDELALLYRIAERGDPAHPHALLLRDSDLVADPLADDLALELSEGQQDVEGEPPHRGRRVELLCHRDEGGPWRSNSSTIFAKSISERVRRSTL